jgi:hypothetical protein
MTTGIYIRCPVCGAPVGTRCADYPAAVAAGRVCGLTRNHASRDTDPATLVPTMPRGRPPDDGEKRDGHVQVRALRTQIATWKEAAELEGSDLSTWLRDLADERAAKVLNKEREAKR